jgi:pilus assembly protein CpaC
MEINRGTGWIGCAATGRLSVAGWRSRPRWSVLACLIAALFCLPHHAAATEVSTSGGQAIQLPVGQGRILHFDESVESVFLADPGIADLRVVSSDTVFIYAKKTGTTNLMAMSSANKLRATIQLGVTVDPRPANQAKRELQPSSPVNISFFGGRAVATGRTRNIEEAVDSAAVVQTYSPGQPPINTTTIEGSQQINIRVRFAEISRNDLEAIGLDWQVFANIGSLSSSNNININLLIESLRQRGALTILAEPNLTAMTGKSASFLAGGEIPVPTPQGFGQPATVSYKPFGVSLEFLPTLIRRNRIALRVRPEVSALSRAGAIKVGGVDMPSLTIRRADTTVEVASGQTIAIGGLFQRQMSQDLDSIPVLGDIPVLGALFQSVRYRRDETELVILITPYLVKPTSHRLAATPLDRPNVSPPPVAKSNVPDSSSDPVFK